MVTASSRISPPLFAKNARGCSNRNHRHRNSSGNAILGLGVAVTMAVGDSDWWLHFVVLCGNISRGNIAFHLTDLMQVCGCVVKVLVSSLLTCLTFYPCVKNVLGVKTSSITAIRWRELTAPFYHESYKLKYS